MKNADVLSFHLRDPDETHQLGVVLGDVLASEATPREAACILLSGELGAGKTSLVRGLAEGLGAEASAVASPTFTIRMDHPGRRALAHLDAWRIGAEDLESVGFDELLASDAVVAIEWPERISAGLPPRHLRVRLEHVGDVGRDGSGGRLATIDASALAPPRAARILDAIALLVRAPRVAPPRCPTCGRALATERDVEGAGLEGAGLEGAGLEGAGVEGAGQSPPPALPASAPFCSPRCRLADLGDWLLMRHRIAGPETPEFDE